MSATLPSYAEFLASKRKYVPDAGLDVPADSINPRLFPWQRDIVRWSLRKGRAALFEDCGLGKTPQQLAWADAICQSSGGDVIILCPLAVAQQTIREADKFSIATPINYCQFQVNVKPGITITNYERLDNFDAAAFAGVVLDESSILKSFTGATKRRLVEAFRDTPYRLACTATPAPNDLMELGNHAEFLGVMPSNEMLARWFINSTKHCGKYRLRKHARRDYWQWVASWSVCLSKPSDLGHDDADYELPPLNVHEHVVSGAVPPAGHLFHPGNVSATSVHREKRSALDERADKVAELVNGDSDQWAVWCDTDYEADALRKRIPDAVEVRGSHSVKRKEESLTGFASGEFRVIVTKPEIGGFGLNWQHCHKTTWFAGYSYERFYQAIRRMWRFGQQHPVDVHVVMSEAEQSIADTVKRKESDHEAMKAEMANEMKGFQIDEVYSRSNRLATYEPATAMEVPAWLQS